MKLFKWFCWHDWILGDNECDHVSSTWYILKTCRKCNKEIGIISDMHHKYDYRPEFIKQIIANLREKIEN